VLPMLIVSADESVPILIVPVVPEFRVKTVADPEAIVNAPLSTILLVVNVCDPMTVPVINVPTPALDILVVPPSVNAPAVMATLPAVAVMFPVVAVSPEVAVINPEIVGVAVQAVPVTVKLPPKVVRPVPSKVSVGLVVTFPKVKAVVFAPPATMVEPSNVKVPGVVDEPMVLIEEAPEPNVFVNDVPVPIVEAPEEVSVVKEPADVPPVMSVVKANCLLAAPVVIVPKYASVKNSTAPASAVVFSVPLVNFRGPVFAVAVPAFRCKTAVGVDVPIPTLPVLVILIFSVIEPEVLVKNAKAPDSEPAVLLSINPLK